MKNEKNDFIICKICGFQSQRIYGRHLKSHGLTSDDYKRLYPGDPLCSENDNKNTSINSGKHMKEEKYKKMFSEKIKGNKNPNHKSKTTSEQRKSYSPFSNDFKNYSEVEEKINFVKKVCDKKTYTTRLDYWINKGFNEEESEKKLKERQLTFTLDICIEKYGEEKGRKVYTDRQKKWQKSLTENGNLKYGYSKASQKLFYELLDFYDIENREYLYFATKNEEYKLEKEEGGIWLYDFVDLKNKKIIEYNGDQYHANPKLYESDDFPHPYRKTITAQEIWNKDERKKLSAEGEFFEILTIWDSEYRRHKEDVIKKCKNYLNL